LSPWCFRARYFYSIFGVYLLAGYANLHLMPRPSPPYTTTIIIMRLGLLLAVCLSLTLFVVQCDSADRKVQGKALKQLPVRASVSYHKLPILEWRMQPLNSISLSHMLAMAIDTLDVLTTDLLGLSGRSSSTIWHKLYVMYWPFVL
jgi:hypothetical protein